MSNILINHFIISKKILHRFITFTFRSLYLLIISACLVMSVHAQDEFVPNPIDDKPVKSFRGLGKLNTAAFSPDGTQVATAGDIGAIVWDIEGGTAEPIQWYKGHQGLVSAVEFSPDGYQLISGSDDQTLRLWYVESGQEALSIPSHISKITAAAFLPDGSRVVTSSLDNTGKLWDLQTEEELLTYIGHRSDVNDIAVADSGEKIATAGSDRTVKIWEATRAASLVSLEGHTAPVLAVEFESDGERVISGSADNTARLWTPPADSPDGPVEADLVFTGHSDRVLAVAMSPDKKWILTGSADHTAKIWDAEEGNLVRTLIGHSNNVHTVAFTPEGDRIMTASADGRVFFWNTATLYPREEPEPEPTIPRVGGGSLGGEPGDTLVVPINVFNLNNATAFGFELEYDSELLTFDSGVSTDHTVISSWGLADAYEDSPGHLQIVAVSLDGGTANGAGFLMFLNFTVNEDIATGQSVDLILNGFSDDLAGATSIPIRISIGLKGDADGNGQITPADVQLAFNIALNRVNRTIYHVWAADVNQDGDITATDVQIIFEAALGRVDLSTQFAKQAFRTNNTTSLSIENTHAQSGQSVDVPFYIDPASDITSFLIDLEYDRSKLQFAKIVKESSLSETFGLVDAFEMEPALVRVSGAALNASPINQPNVLFYLRFNILENAEGTAEIRITRTNDDLDGSLTTNGTVFINDSTGINWSLY